MPTFYDPGADAGEASEALRGLAHASRRFARPHEMYGVVGDLLGGVRSLRQVLDQLATAHASNRPLAFDDSGDHLAGSKDALAAADELHQAATFIDQAEERLNVAMSAAGRIACHTVVPYPHGVPVIFTGERIRREQIEYVSRIAEAGGEVNGIEYGKILVVK